MSFALVFSGQGTQHADMLGWLADDAIIRALCRRLGIDDWRAARADAVWSERNAHAQPLLTGLALAAWQQLAPRLPAPAAVAGYSVGELAAFCAAGVYDADTALDLAGWRAAAMDRCAAQHPGGLLAVTGLGPDAVAALCARGGLELAIRNGPHSVVLGGPEPALAAAEHTLAAQGVRCTRLRIGVASHTSAMRAAADEVRQRLQPLALQPPCVPLFSDTGERVLDAAGARQALAAQIASTVCWDECMDNLAARRVRGVLEIGPGQALARLWNERYPDVPARSCDEFRSADSIARWVAALA